MTFGFRHSKGAAKEAEGKAEGWCFVRSAKVSDQTVGLIKFYIPGFVDDGSVKKAITAYNRRIFGSVELMSNALSAIAEHTGNQEAVNDAAGALYKCHGVEGFGKTLAGVMEAAAIKTDSAAVIRGMAALASKGIRKSGNDALVFIIANELSSEISRLDPDDKEKNAHILIHRIDEFSSNYADLKAQFRV